MEYIGGLGRYLVNLTRGVVVGKYRVKELVLGIFFPFSIYRLILVGIDGGNGIVNKKL